MRCGTLFALLFSLIAVSACYSESPHYRDEALSAIGMLRKNAPPPPLSAEYASIEETFYRAEELAGRNRLEDAGKLYHLTLLKYSLYEQKVKTLETSPVNGEPSASPPTSTGAPPEGNPGKTSIPEPSRIPGNGTPGILPPPAGTAPPGQTASPPAAAGNDDEEVAENGPGSSRLIIGEKMVYTVKKRQSLRMLGARLGVNWRAIARDNGLDPSKPLSAGQKVRINTRRIVPKTRAEGIVINIPDRTLYLFRDKKLEKALPVGLGMPTNTRTVSWQTPTGKFRITSKVKDPTWFVPPSIQKEMQERGKVVQSKVPPGKSNPLGRYALKTSLAGILIHGTTRPESIYTFSSHGCIRVLPSNIEEIFPDVRLNTGGEIIYQPVKVALSDDGRVFLEVHGDVYGRLKNLQDAAKGEINRHNAEKKVDWDKVRSSLRRKSGIPEDVTLTESATPVRTSSESIAITAAGHQP
jgi:lipoprotein-anchoring transpeptidase ErfK/SrfK